MRTNELVVENFKHVLKNKNVFTNYFYYYLFELATEIRHLYSNVNKIQQGEKLYKSLVS